MIPIICNGLVAVLWGIASFITEDVMERRIYQVGTGLMFGIVCVLIDLKILKDKR